MTVDLVLLRGAPADVHAVDVGGHEEQVRAHVLGEQFSREIFVDDCLDAHQLTRA
jgi:hypothetical protein